MPVGYWYVFVEKCLFRSSVHFLNRLLSLFLLSCRRCLYILGINTLSAVTFANISSHHIDCLYILLMVSLVWKTCLALIKSLSLSLFFSLVLLLPWEFKLRKYRYNLCPRIFCLCSLRIFMMSCLIFRSLSHFIFFIWYDEMF